MRHCDIHFVQAGYCRHCEALSLQGGAWRKIIFPALAGLIMHPSAGPVLFDTGYDPAFFAATNPFPQRLYRWATPPEISPETILAAQLQKFGLRAEDIKFVILSHFHADHIAGLVQFPGAKIICARTGLAAARRGGTAAALRQGVLRALIPPDIDTRARFFEDCARTALPGAFTPFTEGADLFGDGACIAVALPGHSPGHYGLAARDSGGRYHFLVADAAWSSRAIRENRPPPRLTTILLGQTIPYRDTLAKLHCVAGEVLMTPSHCLERAEKL
jgi:glyoxylase-like metal-dependent hydrolase (beta-lactamase superfamily II)